MNYLFTENNLALKLSDSSELLIDLKKIRNACPCAHCSGEKDVFGNIYKIGGKIPLLKKSFKIKFLKPIGNYGIKIIWEDGHSNGIYTFDLLKKLSYEN
tara:strand:+ start:2144 stop:2440 length:297 start_codon:yes stop_codon:yes gene_type:complete